MRARVQASERRGGRHLVVELDEVEYALDRLTDGGVQEQQDPQDDVGRNAVRQIKGK